MDYYVVGLGNPGETYKHTRHNAGRIVLEAVRERYAFSDWRKDKMRKALVCDGEMAGHRVHFIAPDNYMNNSGESVRMLRRDGAAYEHLFVIHDDIDLPIGGMKISFGRGAGGHNGVRSIIRHLGTRDFVRIRIGVAPVTFWGKIKKPKGEKSVSDFLLKPFTPGELRKIRHISKAAHDAMMMIIAEGRPKAMSVFNE